MLGLSSKPVCGTSDAPVKNTRISFKLHPGTSSAIISMSNCTSVTMKS